MGVAQFLYSVFPRGKCKKAEQRRANEHRITKADKKKNSRKKCGVP